MRTEVLNQLNLAKTSQRDKATTGVQGGKELGKQDFLNLLMTQMANQDPLDPVDSKDMMQQLAAMGTLEQLQNLNKKIDHLMVIQEDIARASSSNLLGKDVELASKALRLTGGYSSPITFSLEGDADKVFIHITNDRGDLVRSINLPNHGPGTHHFNWDGKDNDGDAAADGAYQYNLTAKTADGENMEVSQAKKGRVAKLSFENGRPLVQINGEWIRADKIQRFGNRSERTFDQAIPLPLKLEVETRKLDLKNHPLTREMKLKEE